MKKLYLFILLIATSSCSSRPSDSLSNVEEQRPDLIIADKIIENINCRLNEEGFYMSSSSSREWYPTIRMMCFSYVTKSFQLTSIDKARSLFFSIYEMHLIPFNTEKRIRPFLHNFPLTDKNFDLSIEFSDGRGYYLQEPYISTVENCNGYIVYKTCAEGKEKILYKEPFAMGNQLYLKSKKDVPDGK